MQLKYAVVLFLLSILFGRNAGTLSALPLQAAADLQKNDATATKQERPEEKLIRTAYAKMSYADEVRIILDTLQRTGRDKWWQVGANTADTALGSRLSFRLDDFQFGKVSDIESRRIGDFDGSATAVGGEVLDVTPSVWSYSTANAPAEYVAYIKFAWKPSPHTSILFPENWPVSVALQLPEFEGKKYTDYATYSVTVTFQGKSRTYGAWVLFGADGNGQRQVRFVDSVSDTTAVLFGSEHSLYPAAFLKTDLKTVPFINKWLHDNAQSCTAAYSEKDNHRLDVCCDPETGRCGVSRSSLSGQSHDNSPAAKHQPRLLPAGFHAPLPPFYFQATCSQFNTSNTFPHGLSDTNEHTTGQHTFNAAVQGTCTYTSGAGTACNVACTANSSSTMTDAGQLSGVGTFHATAKADFTGNASNNGAQSISCQGTSGGTVRSCLINCNTSISISATGNGLGATINFPANQIWSDQNSGVINCAPESVASGGKGGVGGPTNPCADISVNPDIGTIDCNGSPIIIDVEDEGFHLTAASSGVTFDITGTGHPLQMGWTDAHYHDAFLALPGADGLVHNGKELFGNFTPQPPSAHPNGFIALAQYDKPENGGNGDGIIDDRDEIFSRLRLWIDENHDGVCQPEELHRLPELGVYSLALNYTESRRTDEYGNQFRYKSVVNPGDRKDERDQTATGEPARWTYDVFFVVK
jgi:hypothetical protein